MIFFSKRAYLLPAASTLVAVPALALVASTAAAEELAAKPAVGTVRAPTLTLEGYEIIELPALPGFSQSFCEVITDAGVAGGASYNGEGSDGASEVWDANHKASGPVRVLPSETVGFTSQGDAVVEGYGEGWIGTRLVALMPRGVGANGSVLGLSSGGVAAEFTSNRIELLGHPPFGPFSESVDANATGAIVGSAMLDPYGQRSRPVYWRGHGAPARLLPGRPGVCGNDCGYAHAINDRGVIVGLAGDPSSANERAVKWVDEKLVELGSLGGPSSAHAINSAGTIVGVSYDARGDLRAFIHKGGKMLDLNTMVERPQQAARSPALKDEWIVQSAESINQKGEICGYAAKRGVIRAVLLKPKTTSIFISPSNEVDAAIALAKPPRIVKGKDAARPARKASVKDPKDPTPK